MKTEIGVILPSTKGYLELRETEGGNEWSLPQALPTPGFRTSALYSCGRLNPTVSSI